MYSSTAGQSRIKFSQPSNKHLALRGGAPPPVDGRVRLTFSASTMVFVKSFKNNPNCSVLIKPDSGVVFEIAGVALVCEDTVAVMPTVPGTPWSTHLAASYKSSIACVSAGL